MTDFVFDDSALDAKTAQSELDEAYAGLTMESFLLKGRPPNRLHLMMDA